MPLDDPSSTKQSQNAWTGSKRAAHQSYPPILADVADSLVAGARGIDVGCLVGAEDREGGGGKAFGRHIDVFSDGWGCRDEEDGLGEDPGGVFWGDRVVELDHCVFVVRSSFFCCSSAGDSTRIWQDFKLRSPRQRHRIDD